MLGLKFLFMIFGFSTCGWLGSDFLFAVAPKFSKLGTFPCSWWLSIYIIFVDVINTLKLSPRGVFPGGGVESAPPGLYIILKGWP